MQGPKNLRCHIYVCVSFQKDHPSILFWVCRIWSLSIVLAFVKLRSSDALSFFCLCHVCVFQQRTVFHCCLCDSYYNKFIFHVILDYNTMLFVRFLISVLPHIHCLDKQVLCPKLHTFEKRGKWLGGGWHHISYKTAWHSSLEDIIMINHCCADCLSK